MLAPTIATSYCCSPVIAGPFIPALEVSPAPSPLDLPELDAVGPVIGREEHARGARDLERGGERATARVDVADLPGQRAGPLAAPQLRPVRAVVGGEQQSPGEIGQVLRRGAAARIDVLEQRSAGRGAVAAEQLEAAAGAVGGEVD